jgi:hypothetical protein
MKSLDFEKVHQKYLSARINISLLLKTVMAQDVLVPPYKKWVCLPLSLESLFVGWTQMNCARGDKLGRKLRRFYPNPQ